MLNWIEKRTGFISMTKDFLTEDVPGGASYWYVFGSATLFAMIVQIVTGIFLTFFYAPSAATAWESTRAIYLNPYTHFLLSRALLGLVGDDRARLPAPAASAGLRARTSRRASCSGSSACCCCSSRSCSASPVICLPWDMDAYFASQVSLNITGSGAGRRPRSCSTSRRAAASWERRRSIASSACTSG